MRRTGPPRRGPLFARAPLSIVAAACAAAIGCSHLTNVVLSPRDEAALGPRMDREMAGKLPLLEEAEVTSWVSAVGARVATPSARERAPVRVRFFVVDEPRRVNAFAVPGGGIYVMTGLLLRVQDEAELAAVLAHEVGHVAARHAAKQLSRTYGAAVLTEIARGLDPSLAGALATQVATQGYLMHHSREEEREADRRALETLVATPYDPRALPAFFDRLAAEDRSAPGPLEAFFATHPDPASRAADARAWIAAHHPGGGERDTVAALRVQARLRALYAARGLRLGLAPLPHRPPPWGWVAAPAVGVYSRLAGFSRWLARGT